MKRFRVEQLQPGHLPTGARPDQPMRWAVRKSDGMAIYVGMLTAQQNGNACGCMCPACNEDLQAVNADKDQSHFLKGNTRGMFFRHPSGHQRSSCGFLAAKLAALRLLMDRDEVDLPPPRKHVVVNGVSGATYRESAEGQRWRGRVLDKVWLDTQSARITLDDGRTVFLVLEAQSGASAVGPVDGIISIKIEDPAVAAWPPERILAALELDGGFACWERHWSDHQLTNEAQSKAFALASDALDILPDELAALDGLTSLQKQETILHAKVKEILAKAGGINAPACSELVTRKMHDGSHRQKTVEFAAQHFRLSNVRLESPLRGVVPDVLCSAQPTRNTVESVELLIEVAVTHKIDAVKRTKIVSQQLPCIEIDLSTLGRLQGRITVSQLRTAILENTAGKQWVFNPWLQRSVRSWERDMEIEDARLVELRQQEQKRRHHLDMCDTEQLMGMLRPSLRQSWHSNQPAKLNGIEVWPEDITERLANRGFPEIQDLHMIRPGGLLQCLDEIEQAQNNPQSAADIQVLWSLELDSELRGYLPMALIAARVYPGAWSTNEKARIDRLRDRVLASLKKEETRFARPRTHDQLVAQLFPSMSEALKQPFGTLDDLRAKAASRRELLQAKASEEARLKTEENLRLLEVQQQKERAQEKKWQRQDQVRAVVRREIEAGWTHMEPAATLEAAQSKFAVIRLKRNYARSGMNVETLLENAWQARSRRWSFQQWFELQDVQETAKAKMIIEVLKAAGLLA